MTPSTPPADLQKDVLNHLRQVIEELETISQSLNDGDERDLVEEAIEKLRSALDE